MAGGFSVRLSEETAILCKFAMHRIYSMGNFGWEVDFITAVQDWAGPVLTHIMKGVSILGEETVLVLFVGLLYWCINKSLGRKLALGMIFSLLGGEMIKGAVMRRRPYFDHPEISCLRAPSGKGDVMDIAVQGYSFPSMHASNSIAMFGTLAWGVRRRWLKFILLIMPLLIGFSRPFLGVHYPTDVLVGWVLGAVVLFLALKITSMTENYFGIFIAVAILAFPGWFFCHSDGFGVIYGMSAGMLLGFAFEARFVNFSNTGNILRCILRLICGMAVFFGLGAALKGIMPYDRIWRCIRYFLTSFISMGVYPMLFSLTDRLWKRGK